MTEDNKVAGLWINNKVGLLTATFNPIGQSVCYYYVCHVVCATFSILYVDQLFTPAKMK